MKIKSRYLLIVSGVIISIMVISNYLIGLYLIAPSNKRISNENKILDFEDVSFASKSGSLIKGWYYKGDFDTLGIILMHGNSGNRLDMVERAIFLNKVGFSVLLFDFQAHGESIGDTKTFGYLESFDAKAANQFMRREKGCTKVGILGFSLGGAAAILGNEPLRADAYVLESVYPDIEKAVSNRLRIRFGAIGPWFTPSLIMQLNERLGITTEQLSPVTKIGKLKAPILLIAGALDQRTTIQDSKELYNAITAQKDLWIIKGARHQDYYKFKPNVYKTKIIDFFNTHLVMAR